MDEVLQKDLFRTLLDVVPKDNQEFSLIFVRLSLQMEYALCPAKTAHKSSACASSSWCLNQRLKLFLRKQLRKTLASILSEKATTVIKRIRECRTHSTTREAKKKKSGKSVKVL